MTAERTLRLIWFVTWFNVRMLLASEFFILTTFISPLIFATLAFFLFQSGGGTAGQQASNDFSPGVPDASQDRQALVTYLKVNAGKVIPFQFRLVISRFKDR